MEARLSFFAGVAISAATNVLISLDALSANRWRVAAAVAFVISSLALFGAATSWARAKASAQREGSSLPREIGETQRFYSDRRGPVLATTGAVAFFAGVIFLVFDYFTRS